MSPIRRMSRIRSLDHLAVVSRRPDVLFSSYERIGFLLTPLTQHSGAITPGAIPTLWGIGNRCAIFRQGYLELLAILDESLPCRGFPERVDRYEGLHIVAFETADAAMESVRLREEDIEVLGVGQLERTIGTPEGEDTAAFSLVRLEHGAAPECHLNIMQHHTPDLIWQERYMTHPNGAVALNSVTIVVIDIAEAVENYRRLLGVVPTVEGTRCCFETGSGHLDLIDAEDHRTLFGEVPPLLPMVSAMSIEVSDLNQTRAWFDANGVAYNDFHGGIEVTRDAACGAVCRFKQTIQKNMYNNRR